MAGSSWQNIRNATLAILTTLSVHVTGLYPIIMCSHHHCLFSKRPYPPNTKPPPRGTAPAPAPSPRQEGPRAGRTCHLEARLRFALRSPVPGTRPGNQGLTETACCPGGGGSHFRDLGPGGGTGCRVQRRTAPHSLDCRLKLSLVRGMTGGGVCWAVGDVGDTEKRLSLPMALITWLFGLWGRRGLI